MGIPSGLVEGDDGLLRCPWGADPPDYRDYHDQEWGRPVTEPARVLEKLCLEGFQSGLSWLTILRKRAAFRVAFAGFDASVVAAYQESDVQRLLEDAGIVRHRGKIEATVANAKASLRLAEEGGSLSALLWSYAAPAASAGASDAPRQMSDLPATTAASAALAKELRRMGFRFIGPTTAYAAMQALGVVNDHLSGCHVRAVVEEERALTLARFTQARN